MSKTKFSNFFVKGECEDHGWLTRNRDIFEAEMHEDMRRKGCLPVLDIDVEYKWRYNPKSELCEFTAIAKCMKVGRKRAAGLDGVLSEADVVVSMDKEIRALATV